MCVSPQLPSCEMQLVFQPRAKPLIPSQAGRGEQGFLCIPPHPGPSSLGCWLGLHPQPSAAHQQRHILGSKAFSHVTQLLSQAGSDLPGPAVCFATS